LANNYKKKAVKRSNTLAKRNNGKKNTSSAKNNKITGLIILFLGLVLFLSFIVGFVNNFSTAVLLNGKAFAILSMIGNIAIACMICYWGIALFQSKGRLLFNWQVFGGALFSLALLSLLQLLIPMQGTLWQILKITFTGGGGGIFGLLGGYLLGLIPQTIAIIISVAVMILGFLLLCNFKILNFFPWLGKKMTGSFAEKEKAKQEKTAKTEKPVSANPPLIMDYENKFSNLAPVVTEPAETKNTLAQNEKPPLYIRQVMPGVDDKKAKIGSESDVKIYEPVVTEEKDEFAVLTATFKEGLQKDVLLPGGEEQKVPYQLPPVNLLGSQVKIRNSRLNKQFIDNSALLEKTLEDFGIKTKVVQVVAGPSVVRYELQPAPGVKVSRITNLVDDIALSLAAKDIRIEAPVPGKAVIGIEVPKSEVTPVFFRDIIDTEEFKKSQSKLTLALGVDITGQTIVADLADMPHLLIAGATGSGKSVSMNTIICSILYKSTPDEVKFIMIDPKKVELTNYNNLPHLREPVVTNPKKAASVLKGVVSEMEKRYTLFAAANVKKFSQYNALLGVEKMHQIVVLIDELADLMLVASKEVEDSICRLAQLARAAGIHLIVATQRPSTDVITGLIKANIPSRIAFAVSSNVDSRIILDMSGAEKLLGKGDMLFHPIGAPKPTRVQGAFLSESDTQRLVNYCCNQASPQFIKLPETEEIKSYEEDSFEDEIFYDAVREVIISHQASASFLQRRFRIGYNRAARLVESMEQLGIISHPEGNKRNVLMSMEGFTHMYGTGE